MQHRAEGFKTSVEICNYYQHRPSIALWWSKYGFTATSIPLCSIFKRSPHMASSVDALVTSFIPTSSYKLIRFQAQKTLMRKMTLHFIIASSIKHYLMNWRQENDFALYEISHQQELERGDKKHRSLWFFSNKTKRVFVQERHPLIKDGLSLSSQLVAFRLLHGSHTISEFIYSVMSWTKYFSARGRKQ